APSADFGPAIAEGIEIGVSSVDQLRRVASAGPARAVVHIKFETGLGRGGAAPAEWGLLIDEAARLESEGSVRIDGLFSHLSGASRHDDMMQLELFEDALAGAAN